MASSGLPLRGGPETGRGSSLLWPPSLSKGICRIHPKPRQWGFELRQRPQEDSVLQQRVRLHGRTNLRNSYPYQRVRPGSPRSIRGRDLGGTLGVVHRPVGSSDEPVGMVVEARMSDADAHPDDM